VAAKGESFTFKAIVGKTWVLYTADVPEKVCRALKAEGKVAVVFSMNGSSERRTTMSPRSEGGYRLHLHSEVRGEIGAKVGDRVAITLRRDTNPVVIVPPRDLADALREADVLDTFQTMGPAMQRELVAYVENAKREETRLKYVTRVVERACELREKRLDRERTKAKAKAARGTK
jgi:hypothetical protein